MVEIHSPIVQSFYIFSCSRLFNLHPKILTGFRECVRVLKNPFVPFSQSCSEAKNPVLRTFWACFGGV
jgi:hypothetical protein